jgi:hypothetical protein
MHISNAVLSGGIRRSASICIFSPEDEEMMNAKTGDWFTKHPHRARSNNSALILRDSTTKQTFVELIERVKTFGEPGFIFADDRDALYNPCCLVGDTMILTDKGNVSLTDICKDVSKYNVLTQNETTGEVEYKEIINGVKTKELANIIKVEFNDGTVLELTPDHMVKTIDGWKESALLTEDDEIICIK